MKRAIFPLLLAAVTLTVSGCAITFQGTRTGSGGVYTSYDGVAWQQQSFVTQVKKRIVTLGETDIRKIVMDPTDANTVYLATVGKGIYKTNDAAQNWSPLYASGTTPGDIAIDPKDNLILYVLIGNQVHKTEDGGQNWTVAYTDTTPGAVLNSIAVDRFNTSRIFVGSNLGTVALSTDKGASWRAVLRLDQGDIQKIAIAEQDTRTIYIIANGSGIQRSKDGGTTWENITRKLAQFPGALSMYDIVVNPSDKNHLLLVAQHGILFTKDGGETWDHIKLLTEFNAVRIWSFSIKPRDFNTMFYAVPGTFYTTHDAGKTWIASPLPVGHIPTALNVTNEKEPVLYMGFTMVQKKSGFFF